MSEQLDIYDGHYRNVEAEVYRAVRAEAFGEDLGQTSWITAVECDELCRWLGLERGQRVLEVACGSGGVSTRMAERLGVSVVGLDISRAGVEAASELARSRGLTDSTEFRLVDADQPLPFDAGSFDALFCNDAINHLRDRRRVLADWLRVLRPGGRCLYTDPIVVTGCLSKQEIEQRSSIGHFVFTPPGANEALLGEAGFRLLLSADLTESVSRSSRRWLEARAERKQQLCELEGESGYQGVQAFLQTVHTLASERRLSRFAYLGVKPG